MLQSIDQRVLQHDLDELRIQCDSHNDGTVRHLTRIIQVDAVLYSYTYAYPSTSYTHPYSNPTAFTYPNADSYTDPASRSNTNANPYALYRGDGTDLQRPALRSDP